MKKIVLMSVFGLLFLTGCETVGGGLIVDTGYGYPPSHAPAYGRRIHHRYYYYPEAEFYFDIGRNMYFYLDSNAQWTFSARLPLRLRSHLSSSHVEIEMDDDRPYRRHKFYRNKYKNYRHKVRPRYNNNLLDDGSRRYKKARPGYNNNLLDDGSRRYENEQNYLNDKGNKRQYQNNKYKNKYQYRDNKSKNKKKYRDKKYKSRHDKKEDLIDKDDEDKHRKNNRLHN